jgi:tetratricopeptide (TPR) repeat protein
MIMIDPTGSSRRRSGQDSAPGFDGMFAGSAARPPDGSFLGWTPGKVADEGTEGLAWRLEPGTDIVLQLHLQPRGYEQEVRAAVGLYFTDEPPTRLSFWLTLGSREIDLPVGQRNVEVVDTYVLPVDVEVFGLYPHAHYLGERIQGTATLPSGEMVSLLDVPRWNFNQQDFYRFVEPVQLPRGTELTMRISFDNSADNPFNPNHPPRPVTYGPASGDEMANLFVQLVVKDSADLTTLGQDFGSKYQRDLERGMRFLLEVAPENVSYMVELGQSLQSRGVLEEAKIWYRRALEVDPTYQLARYNLATAVETEGDLASALHLYTLVIDAEPDNVPALYNLAAVQQAEGDLNTAILNYLTVIDLEPTHADALNNLGNALVEARRPADALSYYRRALTLNPNHADAHNNLANLFMGSDEPDSAMAHYRRAVEIRPSHSLARFNLGRVLVDHGDAAAGVAEMRTSVEIEPDWYIGWATLAWTLATHPDEAIRNPARAIEFAQRAAGLSGNAHPVVLDALAAAFASNGDFERAVQTAERAIQFAASAGETGLVRRIEGRLAYYQRAEPYIVPD